MAQGRIRVTVVVVVVVVVGPNALFRGDTVRALFVCCPIPFNECRSEIVDGIYIFADCRPCDRCSMSFFV